MNQRGFIPIVVIGIIALLIGGAIGYFVFKFKNSTTASLSLLSTYPVQKAPITQPSSTPNPATSPAVSTTTTSLLTKSQIPGASVKDIQMALAAASSVESEFSVTPQAVQLTPEVQQYLQQTVALEKALSGSSDINIDPQPPGSQITVSSVVMKEPGFVVIKEAGDHTTLGWSKLLPTGTSQNIQIKLNTSVDGQSLIAYLVKDNGSGVYNENTDTQFILDSNNLPLYKNITVTTKRNLTYAFYSDTLSPGGPSLVLREQPAGNKITIDSYSLPFGTNSGFFVAIYTNNNNLPDQIIGTSKLLETDGSGLEIALHKNVSNEMLYGVVYKDNGNGVFDSSDLPLRNSDNLIIIVKFKVVQ